jgi:hypothetical protein
MFVFRIVRTKAMALILGPTGFGLLGALRFDCRIDAEPGRDGRDQYSGVRQIAEAVGRPVTPNALPAR